MRNSIAVFSFASALALVAVSFPLHAQPGNSGLAFLKLGVSARGVSMGDAMSAHVDGAAATFYNPAGLVQPAGTGHPGSELMFMHKEWIQDTRIEFLGAGVSLGSRDAIGLALSTSTVADIEIRTRPGDPEGTFTARDFSVSASYAHLLLENLRVGVTAKFLYEKILINESSGFAADIGAQWDTPIDQLSVGAVVANLGGMKALRNEAPTLPALLRVGPAYTLTLAVPAATLTLASDLVVIFPEKRSYLNAGGEFSFNHVVAARAGYQFGSAGRGLSAGVGIQSGIVALDYAYARLSSDLGNAHTISLAVGL